ncbi:N-acetyltransferase [Bacterioplanes sanyensis]|uniref:GNAT family N-acetyltransferase n=1 Tax=Bacterioplanes sanyensis TaxID=1249553 RepID=UPI00167AE3D9|nr:GNAT family N-acetyltransferase [Bacterioplanes sanyensis]GGY54498.1 N-acetyltransferase [Bacterioplanes sanyensis]
MDVEFRPINLAKNYDFCFAARKDAYYSSFETYAGFDDFVNGYRERIEARQAQTDWFYIHVWQNDKLIGQLEFRSFSTEPDTGYVHLFYLVPEVRGSCASRRLQAYVEAELIRAGCRRAVLSVSRTNVRALRFYQRHGWEYYRANPKHEQTDFYQLQLCPSEPPEAI